MNIFVPVLVFILFALFFYINKQRKTIRRYKHILDIQEQKIESYEKKMSELGQKLLMYDLVKYDEVTSLYVKRIRESPWKTFSVAAEQISSYFSEVPEVYFQNRNPYVRQQLFDGWAQELRAKMSKASIQDLLKVFEGFDDRPDSIETKLVLRIRDAIPKYERPIIFEIWSRGHLSQSTFGKDFKELEEYERKMGQEIENIEKMLNLQCLKDFFGKEARQCLEKVKNRSTPKNEPAP